MRAPQCGQEAIRIAQPQLDVARPIRPLQSHENTSTHEGFEELRRHPTAWRSSVQPKEAVGNEEREGEGWCDPDVLVRDADHQGAVGAANYTPRATGGAIFIEQRVRRAARNEGFATGPTALDRPPEPWRPSRQQRNSPCSQEYDLWFHGRSLTPRLCAAIAKLDPNRVGEAYGNAAVFSDALLTRIDTVTRRLCALLGAPTSSAAVTAAPRPAGDMIFSGGMPRVRTR